MNNLFSGINKAWKSFTRDNRGKRVIWQWPNLPLYGWAVSRITAQIIHDLGLKTGFDFIGSAFLFTWAYLEIVNGASYFRRTLGAIIAIYLCLSYFT